MHAALQGHTGTVDALVVTYSADVEAFDEGHETALMIAATHGRANIVSALASTHNANVDAADETGWTVLMAAAYLGHREIVEQLVGNYNANMEAVDDIGRTALMYAALAGHSDTVDALCALGASTAGLEMNVESPSPFTSGSFDGDSLDGTSLSGGSASESPEEPGSLALLLSEGNPDLDGDDSVPEQLLACTICHHNAPKIRFHPCGHTACRGCSRELRQRGNDCHVCRRPIEEMQCLFL